MDARTAISSVVLPLGAAALGSLATASGTRSAWYAALKKPAIQPPAVVFPVAWSILYAQVGVGSSMAQGQMTGEEARKYRAKLALNMSLNAGWCWSFFKGQQTGPSILVAGALTASSVDLARTAGGASRPAGLVLLPYALWTGFATVLNVAIWHKNRA